MRIILLVVFYIVIYVARISDGRGAARTMLGNSVKHIFKQKSQITRDGISESINDEINQMLNRHSGQSLLVNRIDGFLQNKKNLGNNLARGERNLRRKKRRAKKLSKIARRRKNFQKNKRSTIAVVNLNHTPIAQTDVINRSSPASTKSPSQLENLHFVNKTILSQYPDLQKLTDKNILDKNVVFYKIADPTIGIGSDAGSALKKLDDEILLPVYPLPSSGISSHVNKSQGFQWRSGGYKKDISSPNKENLSDPYPNRRFLLVPISKDLYVLRKVQDSPRIDTDNRIIISNKLAEKDKGNATSALLSFKTHLHHDAKNIGKAYRRKYFNNHRKTDHTANSDRRVFEENANPAENSMPPSYPNFLYPGFPTHSNLMDVTSEISDEQINHRVVDDKNTSLMDRNINFDGEIDSYSLLSSSTSFEMPDYPASYFKKNDRQPTILSAVKLSKKNPFQRKNSLGCNEFGVESTTTAFQSTFDTLDYNVDAPVTVRIYSTNVDKKMLDISQSVEAASEISTKRNKNNKINFIDFSTQYKPALDKPALKDDTFFSSTTYLFTDNILNNQDIIRDNKEFIISTPSKGNDKQPSRIDAFNNKLIDKALFNNYTTKMDLFLTAEDHAISEPNKWSSKEKQSSVNPRTLLMALKPLSTDLQKLLSAVELVNQSISNVQSRLCDKKNIVRSIKKGSKKRKATNIAKSLNKLHHYNSNSVSSDKRRIKTKGKIIANQATNVKLKRRTNPLFLDKLTQPLYKRESSSKNLTIENGRRNFFIKRKLNEKKFSKLGDVERRGMPRLRFNRNLKSLTKNYGAQKVKSARRFTKSFEKIAAPASTSPRLIRSNVFGKSNFLNNRLSLSTNKSLSNVSKKKSNQAYFLSNNKRNAAQHNAKRAMQRKTHSSDMEKNFPTDDPPRKEMTAYEEILGLLDKTKKPRVKYPTSVTAQNVTESLLISTTAEFFVTTISSPYFIEEPSTTALTIAREEEFPEATEYEYITASDFEYYGEDYDNYTGMYEDYEDEGNVTSWYDYTEKATTAAKETIATSVETLETAPVTESSVALSTFTLPLSYTTTLSIDEMLFSKITTEKAVTMSTVVIPELTETSGIILTTEGFTTESAMLSTPLSKGTTNITLKITIPVATKISIEETTEEETTVITSTTLTTESTQSPFVETSTSSHTFSTAPLFTTVPVTTPTVAVLTPPTIAKRPRTTTSKGETISTTERAITVTTIESTTALLVGCTTLHEAATSKITYITRIETEMEDVTPFPTRAVTLATHIPTNATEKITSVAKENKTISIKETTTETIPKELKTVSAEVLTTINATESSYASVTEALITTIPEISTTVESTSATFTEMFVEPTRTITSTYVTTIASTRRVTESTEVETSTIISEVTATRSVTPTIASSPIISEETEITLSTEAEVTASIPEEESPVTQIERTITAEEMTTTEIPTEIPATAEMSTTIKATKTTGTLMSTRNLTITEISTSVKTPTVTKTSATTQFSTTEESTTITTILTSIETPTITETPRVIAETSEASIITAITTTLMPANLTTKILTTELPIKAPTTIKPPVITKIPTTMETATITRTLVPTILTTIEISATETLTPIEIPTTVETTTTAKTLVLTDLTTIKVSAETYMTTEAPTITELTTEISTTIESATVTKILTPTNLTTIEISTVKTLTPTEIPTITELTTTEISTTTESTITTEILTSIKASTISETSTVSETTSKIPTITKIATITESETYIESSTTITTIEILTPIETTTETPEISEISTISETSIITETTIIKTLTPIKTSTTATPTEALTIMSTPTITETPIIIETSPIAETIIETPTITSIYITTPFSVESTTSSMITFPMTEFTLTSITPTIFTTKRETPYTIISPTFFITTEELLISPTISTTEMFPTTSSILENATVFSTNASTITTEIYEKITTKIPIVTTSITTETTYYETTPIVTFTTFSTEITESTTPTSIISALEIYETSTEEETTILIPKIPIVTTSITTETTYYETTPIVTFTTFSTEITESTTPTSTISALEIYETRTEEETTILIPKIPIMTTSITTETTYYETAPIVTFTTFSTEITESTTPTSTISALEIYETSTEEETTILIPKIPIVTTSITTETTYYETTPIVTFTTFSTEITESTTPTSTISALEIYETSIKEETTILITTEFTKERVTSLITTEEITVTEMTTPMIYLSSLITPFFVESTTETTALETVALSTSEKITFTATSERISPIEEVTTVTFMTTSSMEEITNITFATTIKETSTPIALISTTERSTMSATETSLVPTTILSTLPEITTETVETSLITIASSLSITEKPEYMTATEVAIAVTFTPFFESTESALITSKTPATTLEVISTLPETEKFTTESLAYTTESSTILFTEITPIAISVSASTERMPEAETEYYVAQGPQYEEYEEYDKEIPTDEWFEYEEFESTTAKEEMFSTVAYTKPEEGFTSPFFEKTTTVPAHKTKISKLTTTSAYTSSVSSTPYTHVEEKFTSIHETPIIVATASEAETESTASTASEVEISTTGPTFGSTEEYSLPSSTVFEITTKPLPLEYPTVSPEYTESTELSTFESSTETTTRELTLPKFVTQPEETPTTERTTTPERILTKTGATVETSFFVSSVLTTLSEKEAVEVRATTVGPASRKTAVETGYEITTRATTAMSITTEEYATPFVASETEFEFATTSEIVEQRDWLLQQLDRLKEHEREMAEQEEKLKERERQWNREKEERLQIMREKGEMENITGTTIGYITTAVTNLTTLTLAIAGAENLTASTTTETEIPLVLTTVSLPEITITISTPFHSTEEITPVIYTAEMTEQITTEESTTYVTTETEALTVRYTTEEPEETRVTDYIIFTPYNTTPITDLYGISISTVETTPPYSIEETHTTSYETVYVSEPLFTSQTLLFTSTTSSPTLAISTETEHEEIERLKEELRKRERELEERERILLEREKKLERDILEFEKYIKEMLDRLSTRQSTSFSTPVPPIEVTTAKLQVTTLVITEKKENRTTKMVTTSRYETTRAKGVEEKATTPLEEEEIATKRICLNVLANTTIPLGKARRGVATKKICLPYFPEKNEKERSVGRLSRKPLTFQREFRRPSDLRFRKKRQGRAATRKISNLQLLHHEWLSNETAKPLQHFKSFTRIYQKSRKPFLRNVARENGINDFYNQTSLYERRVLDHYENFIQSTTESTLHSEKCENAFFKGRKFFNNNTVNVKKRDISTTKKNVRSMKNAANISSSKVTTATAEKEELNNDEDGFYTVNVVQLGYNENQETHEVISAQPDKDDLTVIQITTPSYEFLEDENLTEEDNELSEETEKKIEEENDYIDDMVENYMNYEERETSTLTHNTKLLNRNKIKKVTESKAELLDQIWPTEKITSYHLGGTRFWELDFEVTEPSVSSVAPEKIKTLDLSVTETTCLHVVLKNERHSHSKIKRNIHRQHKQNTCNDKIKKYNVEEKDTSLKNATRKNALHDKLRTNWAIVKKWKHNLQNLRGSNYHEQNSERKRMVKLNESPLSISVAGNENSITRNRKLCGVKEKKKNKTPKHKDAADSKKKNKKPNLAKSQKSQNITSHSHKNCTDSCITNKKISDKRHKTIIAKTTANLHVKKSIAHPNVIINVNHKNNSLSHERKLHDCINCICDIMNVIDDVKSILDKESFALHEIKTINCSKHKELQDKIVISMNSDIEETKEFPQPHYNTEFLKGQKYIKLEKLEDDFNSDLELDNDHDIISSPGLNLNLPCSQDGDGITWLSSVSRPSYTWKRTDGTAPFGFVAENGDLELRNVNAKDTGNYTCVVTYMGPDNEEPVQTIYEIHLQVVTLPRYILYGENRYHIRSCDERDMDVLVTYLPLKLNNVVCEQDLCNAYVLPPSCTRNQRLVPIAEKASFARSKRGRTGANTFDGKSGNIGVFSSCPAGYGLHDARCIPCDTGTYSEDGISHCKKCPPGTYQPNHGARVCRTCTNPLTKGCYNMLWNSFSAVMVTLASFSVMLSIFLLLLWIICCAKKKFCVKKLASIVPNEGTIEQENKLEEEPLMKDVREDEDQQWDSEYKIKKKKGKFYVNKRRRKQNERKKYEKMHAHDDEWGSHRIKSPPIICPDSYRSHEDYNNYYPKRFYRQGPRLPECDFDT